MFCRKCGAKLEDNAMFCGKCGNLVSASSGGGQTSGSVDTTGPIIPKKRGPLAAFPVLAVVLVLAAVVVFAVRSSSGGTALCAGGFESAVKEAADDIVEQYASGMAGEVQEDGQGQGENGDDTGDNAAAVREAALEQYRQFLQGSLTAEYEGSQVTLSEFYEAILKEEGLESIYDFSAPNMGRYALTDLDMNKMPELQINPSITEYWWIYTIESADGELKITEGGSIDGSWGILYSNGLIQSGDGMHTSGHYDWFTSLRGEQIACFTYFYDEEGYVVSDSYIEEETEAAYKQGYEKVYITHGEENGPSRDEYDRMISDFAEEYGGKAVDFYSLEEILNML